MLYDNSPQSRVLYKNFVVFSCLYAVAHSTVNVVLAFAAAELGISAAAYGGFALYVGFTLSAFAIAKPVIRLVGVKLILITAMIGYTINAGFFCLALTSPSLANLYIVGSFICGVGEGFFWTGQGIYFSMNSVEYAQSASLEVSKVMTRFASTFAVLYLTIEAVSKLISSVAFSMALADHSSSSSSWKIGLFSFYTGAVIVCTISFYRFGIAFKDSGKKITDVNDSFVHAGTPNSPTTTNSSNNGSYQYSAVNEDVNAPLITMDDILQECRSVASALYSKRLLQYIIPFQVAFGINGVFMDSYITGVIAKRYLGEQYIGVLSGILSISSVLSAFPYSYISLNVTDGSYYVMIFACFCFMLTAVPLLVFSDSTIGQWWFIPWLYFIHGCARGAWENTNKAIIGEYFSVPPKKQETVNDRHRSEDAIQQNDRIRDRQDSSHGTVNQRTSGSVQEVQEDSNNGRDTAFTSVSFCYSLAGAFAYICFKIFNRTELALLNVTIGFLAALGFHQSTNLYQAQQQLQFAFEFNGTQHEGDNSSSIYNDLHKRFTIADEDDEDEDEGVEFTVRKGFVLDNAEDEQTQY